MYVHVQFYPEFYLSMEFCRRQRKPGKLEAPGPDLERVPDRADPTPEFFSWRTWGPGLGAGLRLSDSRTVGVSPGISREQNNGRNKCRNMN